MTTLRPIFLSLLLLAPSFALKPCKIIVTDKENGWPVPLVEVKTTSNQTFVTDNAGVIAFDLPEFMGRETWLSVFSHGYELPADGFGYRGLRFTPKDGGEFKIEIERKQIAKRLGRLTGAGIFAESQKLDEFLDWKESGITGCDTVQTAIYQGERYWLWGDTNLPHYPLGLFHTSAATTPDRPLASLDPPLAMEFDYFRDDEKRPRVVAEMPGDGPTWLSGFVALPDDKGKEHLVASYAKIRGSLSPYEHGLAEWNDETQQFDKVLVFWDKEQDGGHGPPKPYPDGHPLFFKDTNGKNWLYFNGPSNFKCPATFEAWKDHSQWQKVENPTRFDTIDGKKIAVASAAVAWNTHRQRWIMIVQEKFGKPSAFGEVWYLEGKTPEGPWGPAVKIATHQNYTFYNIQIDNFLSSDETVLLFEGTYTHTFTDNKIQTPRYDYNQILYRLDLDDPALKKAQIPSER